jgi:3-isopropylmalate dehydrogenase
MKLRVTVLPGDGIGPEVTREAVRILRTVGAQSGYEFRFTEKPIGATAIRSAGTPLPDDTLKACLASDAVLLGAVGDREFDHLPREQKPEAGLLGLRKALGGFANLRPAVFYESLAGCSPLRPEVARGANILFVRELLGGLYFSEPRSVDFATGAVNTMRYTVSEVERVARVAFEAAKKRRGKLASVDKANILETSQLWREVVSRVAGDYPQVTLEHFYVDAFAMLLMMDPCRFDVVVTENLFGDILSDEAAALPGSLGMLASASIGGAVELYEPVHGSAPDIAGRGVANPLGAIGSAALLLRYSAGLECEAGEIEEAIRGVLEEGYRTADLLPARNAKSGRLVSTSQMGAAVEAAVCEVMNRRQAYHAV